jgi:hypothetical protein
VNALRQWGRRNDLNALQSILNVQRPNGLIRTAIGGRAGPACARLRDHASIARSSSVAALQRA